MESITFTLNSIIAKQTFGIKLKANDFCLKTIH